MDAPPAHLLHHLLRRRPRPCRSQPCPSPARGLRSWRDRGMKLNESRWQQRTSIMPQDRAADFAKYPTLSLRELREREVRPRRAKMLLRDFIDDSLYNPAYGYFPGQAVIFSLGEPFDFPALRDELDFQAALGRRYTEFEDALDRDSADPARQLWHTPTELFRPHYGEAIARYLVSNYRLTTYPYDDLLIYEMGAGRGTLMLNILDYIRDVDPAVYDRTRFCLVEISPAIAALQRHHLLADPASRAHAPKVDIVNRSIFDWDRAIPSPCFFLALEVFDNFAHDAIRYDVATGEPLQGHVLIDDDGDFYEFYLPQLDPVAARFFRVRHAATGGDYPKPYPSNPILRYLSMRMPFAANLSDPEYIPTRLMEFFDILERYFPAHRLVTSDFSSLPQATKGLNAPVVQTRYHRRTVPVTTPLVHQGYFDILFPTDFRVAEAIYRAITGKLTRIHSHGDLMRRWAYVEDTRTRSGENPLLTHYANASVMVTV